MTAQLVARSILQLVVGLGLVTGGACILGDLVLRAKGWRADRG